MVKKSSVIAIILILLASALIPPTLAQTNPNLQADPGGPYNGKTSIPLTFDGSGSYGTESSIVTYQWFCGDGSMETGKITTHIYKHPGSYILILTIINEQGECDTQTTTVTITENDPPTLTLLSPLDNALYFQNIYLFPLDQETICVGPITIAAEAFDDVSIQKVEFYINNKLYHTCYDDPYTCTWNKGHLSQTLTLIAYDTSGHTTTITQEIFKWKLHPILLASLLFIPHSDQEKDPFSWITNQETRTKTIFKIIKNMINKDTAAERSLLDALTTLVETNDNDDPSIIFQCLQNHPILKNKFIERYPILYFILLIDAYRAEKDSKIITDKPLLILLGSLLLVASIKNRQTDTPGSFANLFNRDTTFLEWVQKHPYLTIGTSLFIAYLLLRSTTEPISPIDDSQNNQNRLPHANTGGPYHGSIHAPLLFTAEKSYDEDGTITSFEWDFGDGETGTGKTVEHHYTTPGIFLVTLTVTDTEQGQDTDTIQVTITEENPTTGTNENAEENNLFWIISGMLSTIMLIGFALLKYRRGFFE